MGKKRPKIANFLNPASLCIIWHVSAAGRHIYDIYVFHRILDEINYLLECQIISMFWSQIHIAG